MMLVDKIKNKITKKLRSKIGESIMEALVSMMILGILMTTVVSIIRFSMVMTGRSLANANGTQAAFNVLINTDFPGTPETLEFSLESSPGTGLFSVVANHGVIASSGGEINATAFRPG